MKYITLCLGPMATNSYIFYDENTSSCVIVDPGYDYARIMRELKRRELDLKYILLTHGHADHIEAVNSLKKETDAKLVCTALDVELLKDAQLNYSEMVYGDPIVIESDPDLLISDGEILTVDSMEFKCMFTPGHTKGSCVYIIDDIIASGDTLFQYGCGRTDLYGGSGKTLAESLKLLFSLPTNYSVLPGHGYSTTLFEQKSYFSL